MNYPTFKLTEDKLDVKVFETREERKQFMIDNHAAGWKPIDQILVDKVN